jgi:hypothetical protein
MNRLDQDLQALLGSRRWKIGNTIGNIITLGIRKTSKPKATDRIQETLKLYGKF